MAILVQMRDFDDNEFPLAYLITFRCYGTWLHGDERGSMRRKHIVSGTERISPRPELKHTETLQLRHEPVILNAQQRAVVEKAVREVCAHRKYLLQAIKVRTNHVHSVVSAFLEPEPILDAFKSYSTRALRRTGLLSVSIKPWSRHGSTIYLWKERDVAKAVEYVLLGQGDELPKFGES
jgi:REP element-mobilizing transposase RayT